MDVRSISSSVGPSYGRIAVPSPTQHLERTIDVLEPPVQNVSAEHVAPSHPIAQNQILPRRQSLICRIARRVRPYIVPPTAERKRAAFIMGLSCAGGVCYSMGLAACIGALITTIIFPMVVDSLAEAER